MIPRRLLSWTAVTVCTGFLIILMCLACVDIERNWRNEQNDAPKGGSSAPTASLDCKTTKDPIILLLDVGVDRERNESFALRYLEDCPHKCCISMHWDEYIDTADLVGIVPFNLPFVPRARYNQSAILQRQAINKDQVWLGVGLEPPEPDKSRGIEVDGVFHWIGTYRKQADVLFPYGHFEKLDQYPKKPTTTATVQTWEYQNLFTDPAPPIQHSAKIEHEKPKVKKLASWLVSHCETRNFRELLVQSLQKYVPIDIYGSCGNKACPYIGNCHDYLASNYKFYLAFENSLCVDYVTEKLWSQLERDIVPITYAWINNTEIFPPHSFINALDFGSVKELADYMIYLDENENEYRKYFQWKEKYRVVDGGNGLCLTCEKLWQLRRMRAAGSEVVELKRYESIFTWMYSFPKGSNDKSDEPYGTAELAVGNEKIMSNSTCIDPFDYDFFMNWIRDMRQ